MKLTENYKTLANLTQLRYKDRKLYNQLVKNHDELKLFMSLPHKEQGLLIQHIAYSVSINAMLGFLRYLKVPYYKQEISFPNEDKQLELTKNNPFAIPLKGRHNHNWAADEWPVYVFYFGDIETCPHITESIFGSKQAVYHFLVINGLRDYYRSIIIDKLKTGIDPRQIDREKLIRQSVKKTIDRVQIFLTQSKKL